MPRKRKGSILPGKSKNKVFAQKIRRRELRAQMSLTNSAHNNEMSENIVSSSNDSDQVSQKLTLTSLNLSGTQQLGVALPIGKNVTQTFSNPGEINLTAQNVQQSTSHVSPFTFSHSEVSQQLGVALPASNNVTQTFSNPGEINQTAQIAQQSNPGDINLSAQNVQQSTSHVSAFIFSYSEVSQQLGVALPKSNNVTLTFSNPGEINH